MARWFRRFLPGWLRPPDRTAVRLRYGLERSLHDGAVTEMSALALALGMIDDARVQAVRGRVTHILDDLRQIGSVIYPPVLASAGLEPGLRAVAERRGLRLVLDLPDQELSAEARSRTGLLVADHFHTLPRGSVVRVRVRGRTLLRISITDQEPGSSSRREHRAVLRCA